LVVFVEFIYYFFFSKEVMLGSASKEFEEILSFPYCNDLERGEFVELSLK